MCIIANPMSDCLLDVCTLKSISCNGLNKPAPRQVPHQSCVERKSVYLREDKGALTLLRWYSALERGYFRFISGINSFTVESPSVFSDVWYGGSIAPTIEMYIAILLVIIVVAKFLADCLYPFFCSWSKHGIFNQMGTYCLNEKVLFASISASATTVFRSWISFK